MTNGCAGSQQVLQRVRKVGDHCPNSSSPKNLSPRSMQVSAMSSGEKVDFLSHSSSRLNCPKLHILNRYFFQQRIVRHCHSSFRIRIVSWLLRRVSPGSAARRDGILFERFDDKPLAPDRTARTTLCPWQTPYHIGRRVRRVSLLNWSVRISAS